MSSVNDGISGGSIDYRPFLKMSGLINSANGLSSFFSNFGDHHGARPGIIPSLLQTGVGLGGLFL